jgi:hypothetical protein
MELGWPSKVLDWGEWLGFRTPASTSHLDSGCPLGKMCVLGRNGCLAVLSSWSTCLSAEQESGCVPQGPLQDWVHLAWTP